MDVIKTYVSADRPPVELLQAVLYHALHRAANKALLPGCGLGQCPDLAAMRRPLHKLCAGNWCVSTYRMKLESSRRFCM